MASFRISRLWLLCLLVTSQSHAGTWAWKGFEIVGNHHFSREAVLPFLPIEVGDPFVEDFAAWQRWCAKIESEFALAKAECWPVRFSNFDAYMVVDIVEKGDEFRLKYRPAPGGNVPLASAEILDLYTKLYARLDALFALGTPPLESAEAGFLDYADEEMHQITLRLSQLVPPFRENLLEVLEQDRQDVTRAKAANLLNWTVEGIEETVGKANRLLDDPSTLVRNNISRFTSPFIKRVESTQLRKVIVDNLLLQLNRPSHADRNKAAYNLLHLLEKFPSDRRYVREKGHSLIQYIATTSVLTNVRDPAQAILQLLTP